MEQTKAERPLGRSASCYAKVTDTDPIVEKRAVIVSPGDTGVIAHNAPGMMNSPAARESPYSLSLFAHQATAFAGLSSTAAPVALASSSPFFSKTSSSLTRSTAETAECAFPSTTPPEEALSAMVSCSLIFQSLTRLATTSSAGEDVLGCGEHVGDRNARPLQLRSEHERDLRLDPRLQQPARFEGRPVGYGHVIEDHPVVGLIDAKQLLHRERCQADLLADDPPSPLHAPADDLLLDLVGVHDRHIGEAVGQRRDRVRRLLGMEQQLSEFLDLISRERHETAPLVG